MYDYYWNPSKCIDCRDFNSCKYCKYTKTAKLNLKGILLYSSVPDLWDIFNKIIGVSVITENGVTMSNADIVLRGSSYLSKYDYDEFWTAMSCFLLETNNYYHRKKEK